MKGYKLKFLSFSVLFFVLAVLISLTTVFYYKFIGNEVDIVAGFFNKKPESGPTLNKFLFFMLIIIFSEWLGITFYLSYSFLVERFRYFYILKKEEDYLRKIIGMPLWQLVKTESDSELFARFKVDLRDLVNQRVYITTSSLITITQSLSLIILSFYFNWLVGLAILLLFLASSLYSLLSKKVEAARVNSSSKRREYINRLEESLSNYQTFFFASRSEIFNKRNEELSKASLEAESKHLRITDLISWLQNSVNSLFKLFLLFFLGTAVYKGWFNNGLTVGVIASIFYYFFDLTFHSGRLIDSLIQLKSLRTLEREIDFKIDIDSGRDIDSELTQIRISDLTLSYGGQTIFNRFNLNIQMGKRYGIVGASGVGKSTLARLLAGELREFDGRIDFYFKGNKKIDIRDLSSNFLLRTISFLPSKITTFDGSIRENIVLDNQKEDALLSEALLVANINFLIKHEGAERAVTGLSEGQKQRVNIARSIFHNRPVIIFDESFSNLDKTSIGKIKHNLLGLEKKTIIIISHQISKDDTFFDEIIDLEKNNGKK